MKLIEIFEESVIVLKTNRMRTGLSALGIIIGVASVIALMTLGQASQKSVTARIQALGSNLLIIRPGSQQQGFLRGGGSSVQTLKDSDTKAIINSDRITTVSTVASEYSSRSQVSYGRNNTNASISGVTPDYFSIRNIKLGSGSFFNEQDNSLLNKVAIIGYETAEELFGDTNPIDQNIRINGVSYSVVGVTSKDSAMGMESTVYVPLQTAQKSIFGVSYLSSIYVSAKSSELMEAAENQIGYLLLEEHSLKNPVDADFSISSQGDILETANEVTATFTTLLTGIAAISLIVGGIGIMNIMLVTVTERTREIGIRKALGAKRKTIITQFLVESIVLTITGGIIGVIIGVSASLVLTKVMNLPITISTGSIGLAVIVSCVIGVVFGWYPAQKASKLQPIEALRYE